MQPRYKTSVWQDALPLLEQIGISRAEADQRLTSAMLDQVVKAVPNMTREAAAKLLEVVRPAMKDPRTHTLIATLIQKMGTLPSHMTDAIAPHMSIVMKLPKLIRRDVWMKSKAALEARVASELSIAWAPEVTRMMLNARQDSARDLARRRVRDKTARLIVSAVDADAANYGEAMAKVTAAFAQAMVRKDAVAARLLAHIRVDCFEECRARIAADHDPDQGLMEGALHAIKGFMMQGKEPPKLVTAVRSSVQAAIAQQHRTLPRLRLASRLKLPAAIESCLKKASMADAAGSFRVPVVEQPFPEAVLDRYRAVIAEPMSVRDMLEKARAGQYASFEAAARDMQLIVDNCKQFNVSGPFVDAALQVQAAYLRRQRECQRLMAKQASQEPAGARRGAAPVTETSARATRPAIVPLLVLSDPRVSLALSSTLLGVAQLCLKARRVPSVHSLSRLAAPLLWSGARRSILSTCARPLDEKALEARLRQGAEVVGAGAGADLLQGAAAPRTSVVRLLALAPPATALAITAASTALVELSVLRNRMLQAQKVMPERPPGADVPGAASDPALWGLRSCESVEQALEAARGGDWTDGTLVHLALRGGQEALTGTGLALPLQRPQAEAPSDQAAMVAAVGDAVGRFSSALARCLQSGPDGWWMAMALLKRLDAGPGSQRALSDLVQSGLKGVRILSSGSDWLAIMALFGAAAAWLELDAVGDAAQAEARTEFVATLACTAVGCAEELLAGLEERQAASHGVLFQEEGEAEDDACVQPLDALLEHVVLPCTAWLTRACASAPTEAAAAAAGDGAPRPPPHGVQMALGAALDGISVVLQGCQRYRLMPNSRAEELALGALGGLLGVGSEVLPVVREGAARLTMCTGGAVAEGLEPFAGDEGDFIEEPDAKRGRPE